MLAHANSPFRDNSTVTLPFTLGLRTIDATIADGSFGRRVLDDVALADVPCLPDKTAMALVAEHLVIPVELSPTGIVIAARPLRRGSSWE
jgi:hypothetical protein